MAEGSGRGHDKWQRRQNASDADHTPFAGDRLEDEIGTEPFDLAAVQRDDALIDAIAAGADVRTATADEYRLAALLAGWRDEIVGTELPQDPTLDEVIAAIDAEATSGRSGRRSGLTLLRPIAGAAAAVAVVMAGLTVFSYNAQPGDPLWHVKTVVFSQQANSTVAGIDTTNSLEKAEQLIRSGDTASAKAALESASKRVGGVNSSSKRDELNAWHERLMADVAAATSTAPAPPLPSPSDVPSQSALQTALTDPSNLNPLSSETSTPVLPALPGLTVPPVDPSLPAIVAPTTTAPTKAPDAGSGGGSVVTTTTATPKPSPTVTKRSDTPGS